MNTQLDVYIRARYPLLWMVTHEEERALDEIEAVAQRQRKRMLIWSSTRGVTNPAVPGREDAGRPDPFKLLEEILDEEDPSVWVLCDFHPFLRDAKIVRRLREVAFAIKASSKTVILLSPLLNLPPELDKEVTVIDLPLPTADQVAQQLDAIIAGLENHGRADIVLDRRQKDRLLQACLGLTAHEVENALAKAIIETGGRLDEDAVAIVTAEKQQIVRKSGILEFHASEEALQTVGGLDTLKEWIGKRIRAFGAEARAFGLPQPKGILLVGVQGSGKSLVAKAVANQWKLPLLRLDVGRLFTSLVGSSEANLRTAIQTAESIAPVVLWVDEIEKGFSGVKSSNVSDAGTSARVFGSFITWLQEKESPVFVIATANDVSQLPAELVRKGRFDEIFFVDLPNAAERSEIWRIHLRKRNRDPEQFDLGTLAMASDALSGAEIEQAVIDGLYEAFDQRRPLETNDLLDVLQQTIPLSTMMQEEIEALRDWASSRARRAS